MSSLTERLIKSSKLSSTSLISDSVAFLKEELTTTPVISLNIASSGAIDGGLGTGILTIAAQSRHFKSVLSLVLIKEYMDKYPESVLLFYDTEFGTPEEYFKASGIDVSRVIHSTIKNIEELKFDLMTQLKDTLTKDDKVIIFVDSIGNLASKKEVDDALDSKSVADMTRAKAFKSLYRMITPYLTEKQIPMIQVAHVYQTLEMFSKTVVSGGTGVMLGSDNVWIIGRQQIKDGKDIVGYNFVINIEKSRYVKEKSKIPLEVTFDDGISIYGGVLELAVEAGVIIQSGAWYTLIDFETGELYEKKTQKINIKNEYYKELVQNEKFKEFVKSKYQLSIGKLIKNTDDVS